MFLSSENCPSSSCLTRSVGLKAVCRILSGNPELYADIQLQNPEVPSTLRMLADGLNEMADAVAAGDREALISKFLAAPRGALGAADGNAALVNKHRNFHEQLSFVHTNSSLKM